MIQQAERIQDSGEVSLEDFALAATVMVPDLALQPVVCSTQDETAPSIGRSFHGPGDRITIDPAGGRRDPRTLVNSRVEPGSENGVTLAIPAAMHFDDATHDDAAPSRQELLARAAALGPARLTYASILLPTDSVLSRKMQPNVAQRRARLRAVVKVAVGACVAFCLFAATRASAMSAGPSASETQPTPAVPAVGVVPVEKLDQPETTKAPSHTAPQHAAAPVAARWKRK